ncbi:hypothetical protein lerEdw1_010732 [Lerista edwardsae]|nr:hypothetical protein lerEdw1_010732 [Lerista edwardsae]
MRAFHLSGVPWGVECQFSQTFRFKARLSSLSCRSRVTFHRKECDNLLGRLHLLEFINTFHRSQFRQGSFHKWRLDSKMPWFLLHGAVNLSVACFVCLLFFSGLAASTKEENKKEDRVAVLATAELPAKSVDLAALNLTELVNGMLNSALKETKKYFSLLSITSYSSYAFHKVSIVVYNISNLKNIDPTKFPTRYCYCLNNRTNDLTDFTALLVDIIGNSTSYLKEIFKSTSILSVSQSNDTECVYICVMSGRTGRNLSDLWEAVEKSPVINYTFSGNMSGLEGLHPILPNQIPLRDDADKVLGGIAGNTWTFKTTQLPTGAQTGAWKGKEILLTLPPTLPKTLNLKGSEVPSVHIPFWLQTDASEVQDDSSTKMAAFRPSSTAGNSHATSWGTLPAPSPKVSTQAWTVALKKDEATLPQSTTGRKTAGFKGSEVSPFQVSSWLQTDVPPKWETATTNMEPSPAPSMSHDVPPRTQPVPIASSTFLVQPPLKITKPPQKMHTGCPQVSKKGPSVTTQTAITAQKINPCVMELCKFFQQCLCMRDRRYSREDAMRYCMDNYSWFLKNAKYVCEKVKRMAYSNTLKQKCLASICKYI